MGLSLRQERALAITPKCSAGLSIPFSLFLIYEIFSDHKSARGSSAIQRALLGMSCIDILSSLAWFLSTWAVPRGTFALSAGNRASCSYQGFMLQLAIGAPLYNSSLALFYLLMIKYNWADSMLRSIEVWVHTLILSFSIGTAILLLPLQQYNQIGAVCWVIGDPGDCGNSSFQSSDIPCDRGEHAWIYGLALFYGPLWFCVILCTYSMVLVYQKVRTTMKRGHRYSLTRRSIARVSEAEVVAHQAILYSLSFLITWMPSTVWSVAHWFQFSAFWLDFLAGLCEPLQGLWNVMIFARNRPTTRKKLRWFFSTITFGLISRHGRLEGTPEETAENSMRLSLGRRSVSRASISRDPSLVGALERHAGGDSMGLEAHPWAVAAAAAQEVTREYGDTVSSAEDRSHHGLGAVLEDSNYEGDIPDPLQHDDEEAPKETDSIQNEKPNFDNDKAGLPSSGNEVSTASESNFEEPHCDNSHEDLPPFNGETLKTTKEGTRDDREVETTTATTKFILP